MHVLFITSYYPTEASPITGIFFHDQATALHKAGHQVGVISAPRINVTLELARRDGWSKLGAMSRDRYFQDFPVYRMNWGWFPRLMPPLVMLLTGTAGLRAYEAYCRAHGTPDVIHAQNIFYAGALAARIKQKHSVPVVLTEHSSSYMEGLVIFPGQGAIIRQTLRTVDVRLAVSGSLARALHPYAPEQAIDIIGNIVDTDFFTPDHRLLPESPFVFSAIGRMDKNKAFDILLRAFQQGFQGQDIRLEVGGDGPERPQLERFVHDAGLEEQVRFLGWLSREQVRDMMCRSHAIVLTSKFETFGLVLAEAMACGTPVISTRSGGPEDFISERSGRLVPPNDASALAEAMQCMIQERANYHAEAIRADIAERYSEKTYVARLEAIYRSLGKRDHGTT